MADKLIETRIREHYCANSGEWLMEKGKVKEAKLLKEACETIEKLRKSVANSERMYWAMQGRTSVKERELENREKTIEEREERFEKRKADFIEHFQKFV